MPRNRAPPGRFRAGSALSARVPCEYWLRTVRAPERAARVPIRVARVLVLCSLPPQWLAARTARFDSPASERGTRGVGLTGSQNKSAVPVLARPVAGGGLAGAASAGTRAVLARCASKAYQRAKKTKRGAQGPRLIKSWKARSPPLPSNCARPDIWQSEPRSEGTWYPSSTIYFYPPICPLSCSSSFALPPSPLPALSTFCLAGPHPHPPPPGCHPF